jgi:phosphate transport system permease protein
MTTRRSVVIADHVSRWVITVGGIGTVAAVSAVMVLLVWTVVPLLRTSRISEPTMVKAPVGTPLRIGQDEFGLLTWVMGKDGSVSVITSDTGQEVARLHLEGEHPPSAAAFAEDGSLALFGRMDGTLSFVRTGFKTTFVTNDAVAPELRTLAVGTSAPHGSSMVRRLDPGRLRLTTFTLEPDSALDAASSAPVLLVDFAVSGNSRMAVAWHADGTLAVERLDLRENMLTGEIIRTVSRGLVALPSDIPSEPAIFLGLTGLGDQVLLAWPGGEMLRWDVRDLESPRLVERTDLSEGRGVRLSAVSWLLGKTTLLTGDAGGEVRAWFTARRERVPGFENHPRLVAAHRFPGKGSPVTALATSARMRIAAVGWGDGRVELIHVTSHKTLARLEGPGGPVETMAFAPKDDGLHVAAGGTVASWRLDLGHPETSLVSLFGAVWYEGAPGPAHVWQSSAATDDFEPKLGLMPLIFGTLKATVYSLLFGVPLAILAAIYTSEFLHPRQRHGIKSLVEMMASLPSVVLGFLAALVFAPLVAGYTAAILTMFLTTPFAVLLAAQIWQLVPTRVALRHPSWRLVGMLAVVPLGIAAGLRLGPLMEGVFFAGDLHSWLDRQSGGPLPGWFYLLLPGAAAVTALVWGSAVIPFLRRLTRSWQRTACGLVSLGAFLGGTAVTILLALAGAWLLTAAGFDPRGMVVGTYMQRNSLVVGFVMGFAIIPIIYTLAEDALSAVPDHLRSASLAAGATPWQTARWIVIPAATSGIFSAVMIGLGRAVGETMIVLMAAGNTPVLDLNIFNGFRTLSANIAVELPEAVKGSTHYRTLFLAALVLFAMTFVLNTLAEAVRQKFRRKASQL